MPRLRASSRMEGFSSSGKFLIGFVVSYCFGSSAEFVLILDGFDPLAGIDCPDPRIDVELAADPRHKRRCSCCGKPGRIHDKTHHREWHFVPRSLISLATLEFWR